MSVVVCNTRIVDHRCSMMTSTVKIQLICGDTLMTFSFSSEKVSFSCRISPVGSPTIISKNGCSKWFVTDLDKNCEQHLVYLLLCHSGKLLFRPAEFSSELLSTFDVPLLLVHTKFDESNGTSLLTNSKSAGLGSPQSYASDSLLPNYNRKSPLAHLFNCDEIFLVRSTTPFSDSFSWLPLDSRTVIPTSDSQWTRTM